MKGKKFLLGIMLVAAVLIMAQASVSNADPYSGAWLPNDPTDFFAVEFSAGPDAGSFSMYDWGDTDSSLEIFSLSSTTGSQSVHFTQNTGTWYAGLSLGATTLDLGSDLEFGFFFGDGTSSSPYYEYDLVVIEAGEVYQLSHASSDISVLTSDVAPVPIPASVLLLGSGLVGLIGFGKRRMRKKVS